MKRVLFALILSLGVISQAQAQEKQPWQLKLDAYKDSLAAKTPFALRANQAFYGASAVGTCSADFVIVAVNFAADTLPLGLNGLGEILPNILVDSYETFQFQTILSRSAALQAGRAAGGGVGVAALESLEFLLLWLGGDTDKAFQGTKEMYASSIATMNYLFAQQGLCAMNASKFVLASAEIQKRLKEKMTTPEQLNMPPEMYQPSTLNLP